MLKTTGLFFLIVFLLISLVPLSADQDDINKEYSIMMLKNTLLPGIAQIDQGKTGEGILYLSSIPIGIAGQALMLYYFYQHGSDSVIYGITENDGEHYLAGYNENYNFSSNQYLLYGGMVLSLYSTLLSSYSLYAAHRDFSDQFFQNPLRTGKESLVDLITAPYKPENIFSFDVMPFFPMSLIGSIQGKDLNTIKEFFFQEEVDFWGFKMHPIAGFGLNTLFSFLLVTANATLEEILYRGLSLERNGIVYSSLSFGAAHLPNMLMPGTSIENTVLQSIFAGLMGFYAGDITRRNGYNIEKAVTIHFWHNIFAFTLNYLVETVENPAFTIQFRIKQ